MIKPNNRSQHHHGIHHASVISITLTLFKQRYEYWYIVVIDRQNLLGHHSNIAYFEDCAFSASGVVAIAKLETFEISAQFQLLKNSTRKCAT
jgi:hypothetical protein